MEVNLKHKFISVLFDTTFNKQISFPLPLGCQNRSDIQSVTLSYF